MGWVGIGVAIYDIIKITIEKRVGKNVGTV